MTKMNTLLSFLRALFWITLLFALDRPYLAMLTLLSILYHELCHLSALLLLSRRARAQTRLFGLRLTPEGLLSYREERCIAAAGPIGGLLLAGLCVFLFPLAPDYFLDFALCNLLTSLSNLLPIEGYDGYRILSCTLALRGTGTHVLRVISFILTAALSLLSLFLLGIAGQGLWSGAFFLFSLLSALPDEKTEFASILEKNGGYGRFREKSEVFSKEKLG